MTINNLPLYKSHDDYYQVISESVERLSHLPWVKDVLQMGTISCPGISDLDLIVITEEEGFNGAGHNLKTGDNGYFFLHDALWLRPSDLERLTDLFCTNTVYAPRTGDVIEQARHYDLTDEQKFIYLIEISFNKLLQAASADPDTINARSLLTRASSTVHSVALARDLNLPISSQASGFCEHIQDIRKRWVENSGQIEIQYGDLQHAYVAAMEDMLETGLNAIASGLDSKPTRSLTCYLHARGVQKGSTVKVASKSKRCQAPESLFQYFANYDCAPYSPLSRAQHQRKQAIIDHWHYLKTTNLIYSLRSVPAVPFSDAKRYRYILKTAFKNVIKGKRPAC